MMSAKIEEAMKGLRAFMFENVYQNPAAKGEETKAVSMLQSLYSFFIGHIDRMSSEYVELIRTGGEDERRVVCDYISGMTDQYASWVFNDLFVPGAWKRF